MDVTFFVPYVDPGRVWFFPVLGLAAPAVYVVTVVLALYWIIRWRLVRAGIMVALVVVGLFKVSLFYRPSSAVITADREVRPPRLQGDDL